MSELISVIMPTYNRSFNQIYPAVLSVLNQTYLRFEFIIVDDNNEQNVTKFKLREQLNAIKDNRIRYYKNTDSQGANYARNFGIIKSIGGFIAFIDDDDVWFEEKLKIQVHEMKRKQADFIFTSFVKKYSDNSTITYRVTDEKLSSLYMSLLNANIVGTISSVLVKKSVLLEVGLFDVTLPASQDYDLYIRIFKTFKVIYIKEQLLIYNIHSGDRISSDLNKKLNARIYLIEKYYDDFKEYPKVIRNKLFKIALLQKELNKRESAKSSFLLALKQSKSIDYDLIKYIIKYYYKRRR